MVQWVPAMYKGHCMRPSTLIVSLDPGGTTGIASYYLLGEGRSGSSGGSFDYCETFNGKELGPEPHFKQLWSYLTNMSPDILLCENFDIQDNPAVSMISLQYIGVAKLYHQLTGKALFMRPRPNKDIAWLSNDSLKRMGLYTEGMPHRNDATRHLVHFVVNELKRKEILDTLRKNHERVDQQQ